MIPVASMVNVHHWRAR